MARKKLQHGWMTVHSNDGATPGAFNHLLPWTDAATVKKMRYTFEVRNCTDAGAIFAAGYQTANSGGSPDTAVVLPSATTLTGNGFCNPAAMTDVESVMAGKQLVRPGVFMDTSAGGLYLAQIAGKWEIED